MNELQWRRSVGTFTGIAPTSLVQLIYALNALDSVAELKATVEEVWDNPMLSAHLYRTHAAAVNAVHSQAGGPASKSRKRKHLPDPETVEAQPEVRALQEKLEAISLRCWGYDSYDMRSFVQV